MKFDVLVVGAGLAGAALAAALRGSRLKVGIVETRPPARPAGWDPRIYAISAANVDFLSSIGIWQHLDPQRLAPVYDMEIHGDAGGRLDFSAYDCGLRELAWILESSQMQLELWETVKRQHNVSLLCPAAPSALAIEEDAAYLTLEDGRRLESRLIVAADGRDSWVRQAAGIGARNTPYDEKGVVANFRCEKPHRNTAFQWFRKDGVLAYLQYHEQHPHESLAAHVGLGRSDPMLRWADEADNARQMQRILDVIHDVVPALPELVERDLKTVIYGWLAFTLELCRQRIIDPSLDAGNLADACAHALLDALSRVSGIPDLLASAVAAENR